MDKKTLDIVDYGMDGKGIAHLDKKTYFIADTLFGEKVNINSDNMVEKILQSSEHRITPICPYYTQCGGCNIQCMDDIEQQNYKMIYVKNCLNKYKIKYPQEFNYLSNNTLRYRNKISFAIRSINGVNKLGLFETNSHNLVEVKDCLITDERVKTIINILNNYLSSIDNIAFDENTKEGSLRNAVIRFCPGGVLLCMVGIQDILPNAKILYEELCKHFKTVGLSYCKNKNMRTILSSDIHTLYGVDEIIIQKDKLKMPVNIGQFLQVNDDISYKIYEYVNKQINNGSIVLDLYSGAGLLSAILSQKAQYVIGIEYNKYAVHSSQNLFVSNNIHNAVSILGKVEEELPRAFIEGVEINKKKVDLTKVENTYCVIDPPRKGCAIEVLDSIVSSGVKNVIYVSCEPITLARDLSILTQYFDIQKLNLFDMFYETSNIECVVVMKRKSA